jgi:hypothetical protein
MKIYFLLSERIKYMANQEYDPMKTVVIPQLQRGDYYIPTRRRQEQKRKKTERIQAMAREEIKEEKESQEIQELPPAQTLVIDTNMIKTSGRLKKDKEKTKSIILASIVVLLLIIFLIMLSI